MASEQPPVLSVPALAVLGALVIVLVGGFLALVLTGRDTSTYTLFVAGPLVTSVIGAILSQRVAKVESIAQTVKRQTDGQLTAQLAGIHDHLDTQTVQIVEAVQPVATSAPVPQSQVPAARTAQTALGPFPSARR